MNVKALWSAALAAAVGCAGLDVARARRIGVAYDAEGLDVARDGVSCSEIGTAVFADSFNTKGAWTLRNYGNRLKVTQSAEGLRLDGPTGKCDTAWSVRSKRFPVAADGRSYRLSFRLRGTSRRIQNPATVGHGWEGGLFWYDKSGKEIAAEPVEYTAHADNTFVASVRRGKVPSGAAAFEVQVGFDAPNIDCGGSLELRDFRLELMGAGSSFAKRGTFVSEVRPGGRLSWDAELPEGTSVRFRVRGADAAKDLFARPFADGTEVKEKFMQYEATLVSDGRRTPVLRSVSAAGWTDADWTVFGDSLAPRVKVAKAPLSDASAPLELSVTDASAVDWTAFRLTLDGADGAYEADGERVVVRPPSGAWSVGAHTAAVEVADCRGFAAKFKKLFYVGEMPKTETITLRDDGFVLVDGKPFFPIGPYAVCKREFNGNDFDKAFDGLKKGGFNFAHTYGNAYDPDFLAAARKYGFRLWVQARFPDRKFIESGRFNPSILAWYLGDDTSDHITADEELDYHDAVKSFDPTRLTCQADPIFTGAGITGPMAKAAHSRYSDYVESTDVFMPEIYPIRHEAGDPSDRICVAETVRDMDKFREDVKSYGNGAPKSCWPIIQYFDGWGGWRHFPTRDQLFGMTWAAVVHGAHGMTWYTYGGFYSKKYKRNNNGITSTPERWQTICELATQLKELSPVITERSPAQPPVPTVTKGPALDPFQQPSVTCLVKRHAGATYVFAVNAAPEPASASISLGLDGTAEALYENGRRVTLQKGRLADDFKPFGVHIYKIAP